jgi:hypothetical protein
MDPETPDGSKPDPRAERARMILLIVMAVFVFAPLVIYLVVSRGAAPRP